jgi:hypothetical protein
MRRNTLGISQGAASIVALAATAIIVATALSAQLPSLYFVQAAGSQEAGEAEKLAGVKLSLVAVLDDGTVIVSNDGTRPVTMDRLYTQDSVVSLTSPITLQPGQKASINLGTQPEVLAIGLPNGHKVVLKEKPHVRITSMTTSVNPTSTTRIIPTTSTTTSTSRTTTTTTTTSSTTWTTSMPTTTHTTTTTTTQTTTTITTWVTTYSTTYTPLTVTYTYAYGSTYTGGTLFLYTYQYYQYHVSCSTTYTLSMPSTVYTDTRIVRTGVLPITTTATVYIRSTITTSLNTATTPNTLYYVTSVVTTSPSPTYTSTQASQYVAYSWSVVFTRLSYTYYTGSVGPCYVYTYSYILTPLSTYLYHSSPTVTLTTVTVS